MTSNRGKLPEPGERARRILEDADGYFAERFQKHRSDILDERNRRRSKSRSRLA